MDRISSIIREEINKYILSEAIDFTNLNNFSTQLNDAVGKLRSVDTSTFKDDLKKFLYDLSVYSIQVIAAINRCVNANSLNEVSLGNLSNYGINLPPELGGNLWYDAKRGYNETMRFLQGRNGYDSSKGYANGKNVNTNTVPSEKLGMLLQQLPTIQQEFNTQESKYSINSNTLVPYNILYSIIPNIKREYNIQMQNAQGTNP